MENTIEIIRRLFPDATLEKKTDECETYKYSEAAYIIELDIREEISESRVILRNKVVHKEEFKTEHLLGHLPYLRGVAMGKTIELANEEENNFDGYWVSD